MAGNTASGIVDLRLNNEGKYTVWLSADHLVLSMSAAKFSDDIVTPQYMIGIKIKGEKGGKNIRVRRESNLVGQSCNRTDKQITKIFDAVDIVLENSFKKLIDVSSS